MRKNIHKLLNYEYWGSAMIYGPFFIYYLYLALKSRSLTFFTATNPGIETGGLFGESKMGILSKFNPQYTPKTLLIQPNETIDASSFEFPVVLKPDVGERGNGIKIIHDIEELNTQVQRIKIPYLIQEFIDFEVELGIFYYRLPNQVNGHILSVVMKEFANITGDGSSTVKTLILQNPRYAIAYNAIIDDIEIDLTKVLEKGETVIIQKIGNHCKGTKFINSNYLINPQLELVFDKVCGMLQGIYYGRLDLKVNSIDDLYKGQNIKVMELNGVGSEPGHFYDQKTGYFNVIKQSFKYLTVMHKIALINKSLGAQYMSIRELVSFYKAYNIKTKQY